MCISDQMVNESENRCDHLGRFPGRGGHEFIFNFIAFGQKGAEIHSLGMSAQRVSAQKETLLWLVGIN